MLVLRATERGVSTIVNNAIRKMIRLNRILIDKDGITYESDPALSPARPPGSLRSCESPRAAARFDPNPGRAWLRLVPFQFGAGRTYDLRPPLLQPCWRPEVAPR